MDAGYHEYNEVIKRKRQAHIHLVSLDALFGEGHTLCRKNGHWTVKEGSENAPVGLPADVTATMEGRTSPTIDGVAGRWKLTLRDGSVLAGDSLEYPYHNGTMVFSSLRSNSPVVQRPNAVDWMAYETVFLADYTGARWGIATEEGVLLVMNSDNLLELRVGEPPRLFVWDHALPGVDSGGFVQKVAPGPDGALWIQHTQGVAVLPAATLKKLRNSKPDNHDLIDDVPPFAWPQSQVGAIDLNGKVVAMTGTFQTMNRAEAKQKLLSLGAKVSGSLSKKTDYLLVGRRRIIRIDHLPKVVKAAGLGIPVIYEEALPG